MERVNRDTITRTIEELIGDCPEQTKNKFEPDRNIESNAKIRIPEHQRFYVWNLSRQLGLIDSVMDNYPLPVIVLTSKIEDSRQIWYVQDGQQRLTTLQKFILGEFDWNGKYFCNFRSEEKRIFLSYKITCEIIENPTERQVSDIFEKLNCGKPLTDNDKFYNRKESQIIRFIHNELLVELKHYFDKFTTYNVKKPRNGLGDSFRL